MKRRRRKVFLARPIVALGFLLCAGLLAPSSLAHAASTHTFLGIFGSVSQPSFTEPEGLAIDQSTGDLLVIDGAAETVSRWHEDGTASDFSALSTNVIDGSETSQGEFVFGNASEVQVAVDNSGLATDGNIYVPQASAGEVDIFASDGSFITQLTESSEGEMAEPCGVAVDPSGNLYVGDFSGKIHKFENPPTNGNSIDFPFAGNCTLAAGAGTTDGFIFPAQFNGKVSKLDSTTGIEQYEVAPGENVTVTVNPASGSLYVAAGTKVNEYDVSGPTEATLLSEISLAGQARGIAVNETTGNIYVARSGSANIEVWGPATAVPSVLTEPATGVGTSTAILNGSVNPNGKPLTECFFEWGETTAYGQIAPCDDPNFVEVGEGNSPVAVHAAVSLKAGTVYHFRLVAANADGASSGADRELKTPGPTIKAQAASQVTATGAQITGEINPNGEATSFVVQYVTEAQFQASEWAGAIEVPEPPRVVGSGTAFVKVVQQLSGLSPQTTYRFRLVATNAAATSQGPNGKFTTFALPTTSLPDNRAYEMVSPSEKTGEVIPPEPVGALGGSCGECLPGVNQRTMPMQAALDGESVLYEGQPFSGGLAAGPNEYVSGRGSSAWSTESLSTPITTGRYEAFSSDLTRSILFQIEPPLSPEAPTRGAESFPNLYLRSEDGALQPLITVEPPQREPFAFRIGYAGTNAGGSFASPFSHPIFEANDSLTDEMPGIAPAAPEVEAGDECTFAECNLYEWEAGQLRLVNVLPGNASASTRAVLGSGRLLVQTPQYEAPNVDHAISDDGSRIFWSEEESGQVFVRIDAEETLEVPGPGSCQKSVALKNRACFLTASADGSAVLLSDGELFEFDEGTGAYEPRADLSEGQGGFEGILGASEDLSRVYFIDTADLTEGEENANEEEAEDSARNLYAWDDGVVSFIGRLLAGDNGFGTQSRYGAWKASRPNRAAQVSPDGHFLAFMTGARLSEYDNTLSGGGVCPHSSTAACREVFLYAADTGTLSCASCNPSGQRPLGPSNLSLLRPGSPGLAYPPFLQPGNLVTEGEGRLFFESQDALLPQDTNGSVQDVYQWEPQGVGSCEQAGGCVSLISSGNSANDSMFLDSSATGDDIFFITRQRLLPRDKDEQLDLYDARVNGGFEEEAEESCEPDACKGPISPPPSQPSSGSSAFAGSGNPPAKFTCQRGFVKKKGRCVKKKKPKKKNKGKTKNKRRGR